MNPWESWASVLYRAVSGQPELHNRVIVPEREREREREREHKTPKHPKKTKANKQKIVYKGYICYIQISRWLSELVIKHVKPKPARLNCALTYITTPWHVHLAHTINKDNKNHF